VYRARPQKKAAKGERRKGDGRRSQRTNERNRHMSSGAAASAASASAAASSCYDATTATAAASLSASSAKDAALRLLPSFLASAAAVGRPTLAKLLRRPLLTTTATTTTAAGLFGGGGDSNRPGRGRGRGKNENDGVEKKKKKQGRGGGSTSLARIIGTYRLAALGRIMLLPRRRSVADRSGGTIDNNNNKKNAAIFLRRIAAAAFLGLYVAFPVAAILCFREPEIASLFNNNNNKIGGQWHSPSPLLHRSIFAAWTGTTYLLAFKYRSVRAWFWCHLLGIALLKWDMDELELWNLPPSSADGGGPPPRDGSTTLKGKVAVVTGANRGLGLATTQALVERGAHVVMACRSAEKCREAARLVMKGKGSSTDSIDGDGYGTVSTALLNLNSLESAYNLTLQVGRQFADSGGIDYLICNAGSTPVPDLTLEGFEDGFGGMHLGHVAVVLGLLPSLRQQPKRGTNGTATGTSSRVVMVSSEMAVSSAVGVFGKEPFHSSLLEGSGEGDLRGEVTRANGNFWNDVAVYGRAKLANLLFAFELNRRLRRQGQRRQTKRQREPGDKDKNNGDDDLDSVVDVVAHATHTGAVFTGTSSSEIQLLFPAKVPGLRWLVGNVWLPLLFRSTRQGARAVLAAVLSEQQGDSVLERGGVYLDAQGRPLLVSESSQSDGKGDEDGTDVAASATTEHGGDDDDRRACDETRPEKVTVRIPTRYWDLFHPQRYKSFDVFRDPIEALKAADRKYSRRLFDVSLSLLEQSPARDVIRHAP